MIIDLGVILNLNKHCKYFVMFYFHSLWQVVQTSVVGFFVLWLVVFCFFFLGVGWGGFFLLLWFFVCVVVCLFSLRHVKFNRKYWLLFLTLR